MPCGVREHGVTSLAALGIPVTMHDADVALRSAWNEVFGDEAALVCVAEDRADDGADGVKAF